MVSTNIEAIDEKGSVMPQRTLWCTIEVEVSISRKVLFYYQLAFQGPGTIVLFYGIMIRLPSSEAEIKDSSTRYKKINILKEISRIRKQKAKNL